MRALLAGLMICGLFLPFAACGGGGGGGDGEEQGGEDAQPTTPQLLGPVHYLEMKVRSASDMLTEAGPAEVDSSGILTGEAAFYRLFPAPPEPLAATRLDVEAVDGGLTQFSAGNDLLRTGGLGEGNHLALLAAGDNLPNQVTLCRPATGLDTGDLAGRFHFCLFLPARASAAWGRVEFSAAGVGTLPVPAERNSGGGIGPSGLDGIDIQVQSTGAAALTVSFGVGADLTFEGVASDRGRLVMAARTDGNDEATPMVLAAVRAPEGADNRLFAGRYWMLTFMSGDAGLGEFTLGTVIGTVEADGAGGCVLDGVMNVDGAFQDIEDDAGTYSVGTDGTLRMSFIEFESVGGLDELGRHAVLGGNDLELFPAHMVLLVRQP